MESRARLAAWPPRADAPAARSQPQAIPDHTSKRRRTETSAITEVCHLLLAQRLHRDDDICRRSWRQDLPARYRLPESLPSIRKYQSQQLRRRWGCFPRQLVRQRQSRRIPPRHRARSVPRRPQTAPPLFRGSPRLPMRVLSKCENARRMRHRSLRNALRERHKRRPDEPPNGRAVPLSTLAETHRQTFRTRHPFQWPIIVFVEPRRPFVEFASPGHDTVTAVQLLGLTHIEHFKSRAKFLGITRTSPVKEKIIEIQLSS